MSRLVALALALLPACGQLDADTTDTTADTAADAGTATLPTTGDLACVDADDCPPPGLCETVACEQGACVRAPREPGDVVDDLPGDCQTYVCDQQGAAVPGPDDDDVPDDGNACTDDVCDDGAADNLPRPPGSACDGSFVCHADLSCQPCPELGACADVSPAEPNETQSTAAALPTQRDDDPAFYLCEALGSETDRDWFRYTTVDSAPGVVDPAVSVTLGDPRVCIYFQCQEGGTSVVCPDGTTADAAPLGQQGCCGHGGFAPYVDCKGFHEDAIVWIAVDHDVDDPPACHAYQIGYTY